MNIQYVPKTCKYSTKMYTAMKTSLVVALSKMVLPLTTHNYLVIVFALRSEKAWPGWTNDCNSI